MRHVSITVSGKVQGVYFRKFTQQIARSLEVNGYVCNKTDGTVRIVAAGPDEKIEKLIEWCRKGPARAEVESVQVTEAMQATYYSFEIRRTE
jgi:acylphosphatase